MNHLINEEEQLQQQEGEKQGKGKTSSSVGSKPVPGGETRASLSNNDNYLSQQNESSQSYQSDTEVDDTDANDTLEEQATQYQSDDESDALRSLPPNPPFLNTELSGDFETEYEENDSSQDLLSQSQKIISKIPKGGRNPKTPTSLAYAGNPFGSLQASNTASVSRKMRSQSPYETPQTIKVQDDDSEGFPVSQQKRPTPEKLFTPTFQQQASPISSDSSNSQSRSGDDDKAFLTGNGRDLPPPPPPPQPRLVQSSPLASSSADFDSDLLIDGAEVCLLLPFSF